METANIQQALAIYRLSDALIPTAVVGNISLGDSASEDSTFNGHSLQLRWSTFDSQRVSRLDVSQRVEGWESCEQQLLTFLLKNPLSNIELITTPKSDFIEEVDIIRWKVEAGEGKKIVAARTSTIEKRVDAQSLWNSYQALCNEYPKAFVFMLFDPIEGCWMGATPERLISWERGDAKIMSLAGTLTQAQGDWTGKERKEQSVTSGFIEENVLELGISPKETAIQELEMGNIKHLVSEWYFPLERGSLDGLIQRLHPTPAVGGYPQDWAVDFILKHEGFDRGLYSGFIGVETSTEAMYHVVLRCCRFGCNGYVLYAGCGVNADSDPETEWAETWAKMQLISAYL